jgi:hypothetical protein
MFQNLGRKNHIKGTIGRRDRGVCRQHEIQTVTGREIRPKVFAVGKKATVGRASTAIVEDADFFRGFYADQVLRAGRPGANKQNCLGVGIAAVK